MSNIDCIKFVMGEDMKFYFLVLILILTSIASVQPQECDAAGELSDDDRREMVSSQPQKSNATDNASTNGSSQMDPSQLPKSDAATNTSVNDSLQRATCESSGDKLKLSLRILEFDKNTSARFGVGKKEAAKQEMYNISITNEYDTRITDVSVSAQLIKGMKFESTRYYEANRGLLNVTSAPIEFKNDTETKLILDIGMLEPEETKSIILETYIKSYVTDANLTVEVTGKLGAISVSAKRCKATPDYCKFDKDKNRSCPDWSYPQ